MNNKVKNETLNNKLREFFYSHAERSYNLAEVLDALSISHSRSPMVKQSLRNLVCKKVIRKLKGKGYSAAMSKHLQTGIFEPGRFGSGFVRVSNGDLYIPEGCTGTALPGDMVQVEIFARRSGKNPEARVIDVIERKKHRFVGEFKKGGAGGYVLPDSGFLKRQFMVPEKRVKSACNGQMVVVDFVSWENENTNPVGEIAEIIGYPGEKGVDVLSIALAAGIPKKFPDKVVKEAERLKELRGNTFLNGRKDFRNEDIFTIDPEDAKDFDDAVSLKTLPDGKLLLGVYIADVTAYVPEGGTIDKEASNRGTSVYLINKVIPMLPEKLSNDLCSLKPGVERPAYCILMTCTQDGEVAGYEITEGVIKSKYRFSYEEAQAVIEGKKRNKHSKTLRKMNRFAKVLRRNRFQKGGLDFYVPETKFELDDNGNPVSLSLKPILDSNILIEEFMLLANKTAARHKFKLERKLKMNLPFLYRVHEKPEEERVQEFFELARSLGCTNIKGSPGTSRWFQNILRFFSDKPEKIFVEEIALRSMTKARYQPQNSGHFGLGFKNYTHFTSPIRRYPDLVIHRLLKKFNAGITSTESASFIRRMNAIGKHSTEMEIRAMKAEREAAKLKKLEYMQNKVGEEYSGLINGVTSYGVFVELEDILVEGLVHVRDMNDDFYVFEEKKYRLVGQVSGKSYKLGDRIAVRVIKVSVERGHLDLIPV